MLKELPNAKLVWSHGYILMDGEKIIAAAETRRLVGTRIAGIRTRQSEKIGFDEL
jgi:hypothetical protein